MIAGAMTQMPDSGKVVGERSLIILADDDGDDRSFIEEAFRRNAFGGLFSYAENGLDLLQQLSQLADGSSSHGQLPNLILLDLNMPLMDGVETLKAIKQHSVLKHIPVVVLTSSLRETDEARCRELGCLNFYNKPFTLSDYDALAASIVGQLGKQHAVC